MKEAFGDAATMWHREMRPKHFTHAGAREYNYARRSERYTRRKLRTHGHTYPLVWTGATRNLTRICDVRTTSKGARVVMRAPKLLRPGGPNMAEELRTVSAAENRRIAAAFDRSVNQGLRDARPPDRTVRI